MIPIDEEDDETDEGIRASILARLDELEDPDEDENNSELPSRVDVKLSSPGITL